jgi:membrane protease subunit (stomatin/prohibitin family)
MVSWDSQPSDDRTGNTDPIYACKYNGSDSSNLSTHSQLLVRESQEAVLFTKGQLLGKFGPGLYTLNTENLPLLRRLYGLPFGGKNPFTAEVWFVNKLVPLTIDWKTSRMMYQDPDYQVMVPLYAEGRYGLKVQEAEKFLIKLVGAAPSFSAPALREHFKGALESKTKSSILSYMQSQRVGIKSISAYLEPLSASLRDQMLPFWEEYGFHLEGFYITSIDVDDSSPDGQNIREAMNRDSAQKIAGYSWQQSKAFEVAGNAVSEAKGGGGLLGALLVTGMMGGGGGGGMGAGMLQPNPVGSAPSGASGQVGSGTRLPPREVFCSNCAKKYSNTAKFCPHCGDPYSPCPNCGADNDGKARRCVACGIALATAAAPEYGTQPCRKCGSALSPKDAFCAECGQKVEQK